MPRPIWRGHVSFGLVSVPANLYPAVQRADLQLHMIDSRNHSRVRYERVNAETGEEVPWDAVVKAYEHSDGNYIAIGEADLKRAAPEATRTIEVQSFVSLGEIDLALFDTPYYLEPGKGGAKGYVLLREAMRASGKAGIARVVIRTRQYISALAASKDVLTLHLLRYQQELRGLEGLEIPGPGAQAGVTEQELKVARTLIASMTTRWKPGAYRDEYRDALMKWIEKKAARGETDVAPETLHDDAAAPAPINFMAALRESVRKAGGKKPAGARKAKAVKKPAARRRAG